MLVYLITENDPFKLGLATGIIGLTLMLGGVCYAPFIDHVKHTQTLKVATIISTLLQVFVL